MLTGGVMRYSGFIATRIPNPAANFQKEKQNDLDQSYHTIVKL